MIQNTANQQWNSGKVLAECLNLLADIDDLQTAVCILIALGERRSDLPINESVHVCSISFSLHSFESVHLI